MEVSSLSTILAIRRPTANQTRPETRRANGSGGKETPAGRIGIHTSPDPARMAGMSFDMNSSVIGDEPWKSDQP
jgi:hypothetical protein